ncbi:nardilysin-like [Brevipalpus obovatus]|uniref:nardilysin-like n=1 Tax=Brevipalpus obovatus TaxID=246614 RepID=UPI003D9E5B38
MAVLSTSCSSLIIRSLRNKLCVPIKPINWLKFDCNHLTVNPLVASCVNLNSFYRHHSTSDITMSDTVDLSKFGLIEDGGIYKSISDKKRYKLFKLSNGLTALIISDLDPNVDQSPIQSRTSSSTSDVDMNKEECSSTDASESEDEEGSGGRKLASGVLSVRVGSFSDPKDVQGMSHLLEHTIFMGNEDFPQPNGFESYISERSGYYNAHTEYERTVYQFQVPHKFLDGSLERMAAMFVNPLFTPSCIESETIPVDNEFKNLFTHDKSFGIFMTLAKKDHPLGTFAWGNAKSLIDIPKERGIDTAAEVKKFFKQHYYASNMNVVVQGEYDLKTLESMVIKYFSRIHPATDQVNPYLSVFNEKEDFPYTDDFFKLHYIEYPKSGDYLRLTWWLPPRFNCYKTRPLWYVTSVLGHEGKGSLFSYLKRKGYALELMAGNDESLEQMNQFQALFVIDVKLTEFGLKNVDKVASCIFSAIKKIGEEGPLRRLIDEDHAIRVYSFRYTNEPKAMKNCTKLSENLCTFDPEHCIIGTKMCLGSSEAKISEAFKYLVPEKANKIILSKKAFEQFNAPTKTDFWLDAKFKVSDVPKSWSPGDAPSDFLAEFHQPEVNPYIATNFDILPPADQPHQFPMKVDENAHYRLWYKKDDRFSHPKLYFSLFLRAPFVSSDVRILTAIDLYLHCFSLAISEDVYPALIAGLQYDNRLAFGGIMLSFSGFNDKIHQLTDLISKKITSFEVEDELFNDVRKDLASDYYNSFTSRSQLVEQLKQFIIKPFYWPSTDRRNYILEMPKDFVFVTGRQFFSNIFMECLIQGNSNTKDAIKLVQQIAQNLNFKPLETHPGLNERVHMLPIGDHTCRVLSLLPDEKKSITLNYYQIGPMNTRISCLMDILVVLMDEPLFDCLRTKEGLGYEVYMMSREAAGIGGFAIYVHSEASKHTSSHIDGRIECFLKEFVKKIEDLDQSEFKKIVDGIIKGKSAPFVNLSEESKFHWKEIVDGRYYFDCRQRQIKILQDTSPSDFKTWALGILTDPEKRRKICLQVVAHGKQSLDECLVANSDPSMSYQINLKEIGVCSRLPEFNSVACGKPCDVIKDQSENGSGDSLDDKKFFIKYLVPAEPVDEQRFVVSINEFKKGLNLYPHPSIFLTNKL